MTLFVSKALLVVLLGIYAIRASDFLFTRARFQPLTFVAAAVVVIALALFHRPPVAHGAWLITAILVCLTAVLANTMLLIQPDEAHSSSIDKAFSAISVAAWSLLAAMYGSHYL
jgi:hypothetical protein